MLCFKGVIPKYIIYDDACHLQPFCEARINQNIKKSLHFDNKKYVVDKLHMKGHTGVGCRQNNDPPLFPELDDCNTVVCEQVNFWLGKFKHILKHMSFFRFNFFLYIILDVYNQVKLQNVINIADAIFFDKTDPSKRKIDEIDSDTDA
jgi:hypothetical protein